MSRCIIIIKYDTNMAKLYSKKLSAPQMMKPKKEVVSFLLNYSKALKIVKINGKDQEIISN